MTANSVNHYIRSVKVFLYWCMEQDEIALFKIKMVKAQETIKDVYTQEELYALIQPPKREDSFVVWRSWAIINFILGTAAREATVCEMQMQDISFDDRTITFRHQNPPRTQEETHPEPPPPPAGKKKKRRGRGGGGWRTEKNTRQTGACDGVLQQSGREGCSPGQHLHCYESPSEPAPTRNPR